MRDPRTPTLLSAILSADPDVWASRIRAVLTDDLRRSRYRGSPRPEAGHCYVATEALYHLLGGAASGWVPTTLRVGGDTHWYLRHRDGRIADPTVAQFDTLPPYALGRGRGFLTREPSRRTRVLLDRIGAIGSRSVSDFDTFDEDDAAESPPSSPFDRAWRAFGDEAGAIPEQIDAIDLFRSWPSGADPRVGLVQKWRSGTPGWFLYAPEARTEDEARRVGKQARVLLLAPRSLRADQPRLYDLPLTVGWSKGEVVVSSK